VLLAVAAGGVAAYQAIDSASAKTVQLKKVVNEKADRAIQDLKDLIAQNTR
jgi:hypothetical protein